MDFGTLKNMFTQTYIESHINGDVKGKELYKKFLGLLKESETLKSYFLVYKNLENKTASNEFEANEYLKENLVILDKFRGDNSIVVESKKLINLLENNDINIDTTPTKLNESLHTLTTSRKSISNIDELHEAKFNVIKSLMEDKTKLKEDESIVRENIDVQKFLTIVTEKYNNKYANASEEEKNIIKTLREGNDESKSLLLHTMIKETVSLVNEKLVESRSSNNIELTNKLLETKDVIYSMDEYNVSTIVSDIKKLYEIKTVFVG